MPFNEVVAVSISKKAYSRRAVDTWTPLSVSTAVRWYDPTSSYLFQDSALTTPATSENDPVGGWDERSIHADNGSGTGSSRPVYKPNGFAEGKPGLLFDGGDYIDVHSLTPLFSGTDMPYTLIIALKASDVIATNWYNYFGVGRSDNAFAAFLVQAINSSPHWFFRRRDNAVTTVDLNSGAAPTTATSIITIVFTGTTLTLRVNGSVVYNNVSCNVGTMTMDWTCIGCLPYVGTHTYGWKGLIGDVIVLPEVMSDNNINLCEQFVAERCGIASPLPMTSTSSLHAYQVVQRNGSDQADLTVSGTILAGGTHDVEARWNGGVWTTIDTSASGTFTGTLSAQNAGQGELQVRLTDYPTYVEIIPYVGIGDVFVVVGQSNASGRGYNNQSYSHPTLKAGVFGNDYWWKDLTDPYDSAVAQVDTVSSDTGPAAAGSWLPLLATLIMADQNVPVAFVPGAKGGSAITTWQPGADHNNRTTLYGSMNYRTTQVGGAKCVLWWQGESDALAGMSAVNYNNYLDTVANTIMADQSIPLMACKLQNSSIIPDVNEATINTAIDTAWTDNANVLEGPDFSDIGSDDDYHLQTDAKLLIAAQRWFVALQAEFYP